MSDVSREPTDRASAARAVSHVESLNTLGRHQQALDVATQALAGTPDDPELLLQAAVALLGLERADEARRLLARAAAADPDSSRVQRLTSFAALRQGRPGEASQAAAAAVRLGPFDPWAHTQLARANAACHDRTGAVAAAERALQLAPDLADSHVAMADALYPEGIRPPKDDLRTAEAHLLRALQIEPGNAAALNDVARVQLALGRQVSAAGHLASAVRADPMAQVVQHNMDVVLLGLVARAHGVFFVMWFVSRRITGVDGGVSQRWVLWLLAALGFGLVGWVVVRLRRQVPAHLGAFVRGFVRRERLGALWAACLALTAVSFLAVAIHPAVPFEVAGAVTLLAGAVVSWVRYVRERRAAKRRGLA